MDKDNKNHEEKNDDLKEAQKRYDFVRFAFSDIHGVSRSKLISRTGYEESFSRGTAFLIGNIGLGLSADETDEAPGFGPCIEMYSSHPATKSRPSGNIVALPMPGTLHALPEVGGGGEKYKVGEVLCETAYPWNYERQEECPRYIARQMLDKLESMNYQLYSSFELEFHLVDPKTLKPVFSNPNDKFSTLVLSEYAPVLLEMVASLESMGVGVIGTHVEAAAGQFELILSAQYGIKAADNAFLAKTCAKEVARKHGLMAVFMTKPDPNRMVNASHFNHSLRSTKDSQIIYAFSDPQDVDLLSATFRSWMGGLVAHYDVLATICGPTYNCYRRLGGLYTPNTSIWGIDNRMGAFRVKTDFPAGTYIESRLPTGSANFYLALAATVAAGIDGLSKQLPCPRPVNSIYNEASLKASYQDVEQRVMKANLEEALGSLADDSVMVEALGEHFVKLFVLLKKKEIDSLKGVLAKYPSSETDDVSYKKEWYMYKCT